MPGLRFRLETASYLGCLHHPGLEAFDFDAACEEGRYNQRELIEVRTELRATTERLVAILASFQDRDWSRTALGSDGMLRGAGSLARRAVHEVVHHVLDVEKNGGSRKPTMTGGRMPTIHRVGDFSLQWGESLRWDDRRQRLYFVDCATQTLHWLEHAEPPLQSLRLPRTGREAGDRAVATLPQGPTEASWLAPGILRLATGCRRGVGEMCYTLAVGCEAMILRNDIRHAEAARRNSSATSGDD